jgi:hypothetical protein
LERNRPFGEKADHIVARPSGLYLEMTTHAGPLLPWRSLGEDVASVNLAEGEELGSNLLRVFQGSSEGPGGQGHPQLPPNPITASPPTDDVGRSPHPPKPRTGPPIVQIGRRQVVLTRCPNDRLAVRQAICTRPWAYPDVDGSPAVFKSRRKSAKMYHFPVLQLIV